jgi:hypothetical protein
MSHSAEESAGKDSAHTIANQRATAILDFDAAMAVVVARERMIRGKSRLEIVLEKTLKGMKKGVITMYTLNGHIAFQDGARQQSEEGSHRDPEDQSDQYSTDGASHEMTNDGKHST